MSSESGQRDQHIDPNAPLTLADMAELIANLREEYGDRCIFQTFYEQNGELIHEPVTHARISIWRPRQ